MNNLWALAGEIRQLERERDRLNRDKTAWYGSIGNYLSGPATTCGYAVQTRHPIAIRSCITDTIISVADMAIDRYNINRDLSMVESKLRDKQMLLNSNINNYTNWYNKLGGIKLDAKCHVRGDPASYTVGIDMSNCDYVTIEFIRRVHSTAATPPMRQKYTFSKYAFEYAMIGGIGNLYPGLYFTIDPIKGLGNEDVSYVYKYSPGIYIDAADISNILLEADLNLKSIMTGFMFEHKDGNITVDKKQVFGSFTQIIVDKSKGLNESQINDMIKTLNCRIWFETVTNIVDFDNIFMGATNRLCVECTSASADPAVSAAILAAKSEYEEMLNANYYSILAKFPCLQFIDEITNAMLVAKAIKLINIDVAINIESYLIGNKVLSVQHRDNEITKPLKFESFENNIMMLGKEFKYVMCGGMIIPDANIALLPSGAKRVIVRPGKPLASYNLIMTNVTKFRLQIGAIVIATDVDDLKAQIRTIFDIKLTSVLPMIITNNGAIINDNLDFVDGDYDCRFTFGIPEY
jgi:hypothetical protein